MADLASKVMSQLAASLNADDALRPWLGALTPRQGREPLSLGIQCALVYAEQMDVQRGL